MSRKILGTLAILAGLSFVAMPAKATVVAPGGTVTPTPTNNTLTGAIIADTGPVAFSFASSSGTVREIVVRTADNTLAFAKQVTLTGGPGGDIGRLTNANFAFWITDLFQDSTGLAGVTSTPFVVGTIASLSADRSGGPGDTVGFNFSRALFLAPNTSWVQVTKTNATTFVAGTVGVIDGGGQTVPGFAPAVVPEPGTVALALTGLPLLIGGAWLRRRRSQA